MKPKVSIIVPIYNSEKYLTTCLSHLVNQTLKEIEIILIDDNSNDNSYQIMNNCYTQFPDKIKLIHLDTSHGAGGARNVGLENATGEYIGFVDSDDIADTSMFEKLYLKAIEENFDIVDCGFYNEKEDNAIIYTSDELTGILTNDQRNELIVSGGYIWSKIFHNDYLKKHNINFRENVILEDADFLTYIFATVKSIGNVKEILYKYSDVENSLSKIIEPNGYLFQIKHAMQAIYDKVHKLQNYTFLLPSVEYEILQLYLNGIVICLMNKSTSSFDFYSELKLLRTLKNKLISGNLSNKYILNKMSKDDIALLKKIDYSINSF